MFNTYCTITLDRWGPFFPSMCVSFPTLTDYYGPKRRVMKITTFAFSSFRCYSIYATVCPSLTPNLTPLVQHPSALVPHPSALVVPHPSARVPLSPHTFNRPPLSPPSTRIRTTLTYLYEKILFSWKFSQQIFAICWEFRKNFANINIIFSRNSKFFVNFGFCELSWLLCTWISRVATM